MSDENHKAEALRLLKLANEMACDGPEAKACVQEAQVHSNLAIAEELRGLCEDLSGLVSTNQIPTGGTDRRLRVTHE